MSLTGVTQELDRSDKSKYNLSILHFYTTIYIAKNSVYIGVVMNGHRMRSKHVERNK
jgi:hypothetical protein